MQNVKFESIVVYFDDLYWKVYVCDLFTSSTSDAPDASSPWEGDFSVFDNWSPRFVSWGRFPAQLLSSAPVKGGWSCFAATYCFPWRIWGAGWRWRSPMSGRSSDFSSAKSSSSHLLIVLQLQLFKLLISSVYFNISSASCSSTFLQQGFLQLLIGKGEFLNCFHYHS